MGCLLVAGTAVTWAQDVFPYAPEDLGPGDGYHLAFVTFGELEPSTSNGIDFYNDYVNIQAGFNPLLQTAENWSAIVSVFFTHARDNACVEGPVYRLDGQRIADGYSDIWDGDIQAPMSINQFGVEYSGRVWTGTRSNGTGDGHLDNPNGANTGRSFAANSQWIDAGFQFANDFQPYPIYALSEYFQVAPCDLNVDGSCNLTDLNNLLGYGPLGIGGVPVPPGAEDYDITLDGILSLADVNVWLFLAAEEHGLAEAYKPGDANLDGYVDGLDFVAWNGNKFSSTLAWDGGDWNADGVADGQDFVVWNANKFTSSHGNRPVPEPTSGHLVAAGGILLLLRIRTAEV